MPTLKTRRRYTMLGSDYSAQEVRMFASNTRDPAMIKVFKEGRDLYSEVASIVYNLPYNDCCEFKTLPDGTKEFNLAGKKRRTACKSLILGLQYGRGIRSIAEQIKSHDGPVNKNDIAEAKKLSDDFFHHYPKAKEWMENSYKNAREIGYVEDLWGRRRRLPDASLPKYEFTLISGKSEEVNPLIGTTNKKLAPDKKLVNYYTTQLENSRAKEARDVIVKDAERHGIRIKCNSGFIAQAERQSLNSPIQGGSATMTKLAMRNIDRDDILKELDFHLLVPVHDEIIGEAPVWNVEKAKKRMEEIMIHAGEPECEVPMKCDCDSFFYWYQDIVEAHIQEDFEKLLSEGKSKEEAEQELMSGEYCEFLPQQVLAITNQIK